MSMKTYAVSLNSNVGEDGKDSSKSIKKEYLKAEIIIGTQLLGRESAEQYILSLRALLFEQAF